MPTATASIHRVIIIAACLFLSACTVADSVEYSTIDHDDVIQFFTTSAQLDEEKHEWIIPIHAWVYEPEDSRLRLKSFESLIKNKYGIIVDEHSRENFKTRSNLLISDNERNKKIVIELAGQRYTSNQTESNGHATWVVNLPESEFNSGKSLSYQAVLKPDDERIFNGSVRLLPPHGISVISDIDDTVKISHVTDRKRLLEYTFLKDFEAVPGMAERYRQWQENGMAFHFVSSSPWYLYEPITRFLADAEFPGATLSLKSFRFRDKSLLDVFKKGTKTKPKAIEAIIKRYPHRKFILVGDSGEQDPEVYAGIAKTYPEKILKIFIRNIDRSEATDKRVTSILEKTAGTPWQVFRSAKEIELSLLNE